MMIANRPTKLSPAHRALIGTTALALVALSLITGLLTRDVAIAQSRRQKGEATSGVAGGVSGGVFRDGQSIRCQGDNNLAELEFTVHCMEQWRSTSCWPWKCSFAS